MSHQQQSLGAISTSHHLATEAGAAVIAAGGNAVDAAIAAAAALCVVYPNNVALGGDLVALVRSPDGRVRFLNATGVAPLEQTLESLRTRHGDRLPPRGIDTVTVPGGIRGWEALHAYGATRDWNTHFGAAIEYAEQGVPTPRSVARAIVQEKETLELDPGCAALFLPSGKPLDEGARLVQPNLAHSLRQIASRGAEEFYVGDIAKRWVSGLARLGSRITLRDTKNYQAQWGEPLEGAFRNLRILTGPPNTSGFALIRALNAVSNAIEDPLGVGAGALAQAFCDSNAVRAVALADPDTGVDGKELIAMSPPSTQPQMDGKPQGDTVGLSAITSDGWAVSLINSVYWAFGAAILEPDTGILFQNRGTSFSLDVSSPNAFAGGKRPKHTLMPVLVLSENDVLWVPATMGGSAQPQIHTQLLLRSIDGAARPYDATHAPRWIVEEPDPSGEVRVTAEEDVPHDALSSIARAGFPIDIVPRYTEDLGHANLIRNVPGGYEAASDPRSDGSAIVVTAA